MLDHRGLRDRVVWNEVANGLRVFVDGPFNTMPWIRRSCLFCGDHLTVIERLEQPDVDEECFVDVLAALEVCMRCRYWRWHFLDSEFEARGGSYSHRYVSYVSKVREFAADLPDGCSSDIAQWLRRRPEAWEVMSPRRLETFVADVFRSNHGDAEVIHVGGASDGGVDVVLVESASQQWLIQVKRRARIGKGEGVSTIRNLLGAMMLHPNAYGIVVSTADHFTYQARRAASAAAKVGRTVKLVDRGLLNRMMAPLLPSVPWDALISSWFPAYGAWLSRQVPSVEPALIDWQPQSVRIRAPERYLHLAEGELLRFWHNEGAPTT
jgi:HJR/Mrr/RecB family endonuclease